MWLWNGSGATLQHFLKPQQSPLPVGMLATTRLIYDGDTPIGILSVLFTCWPPAPLLREVLNSSSSRIFGQFIVLWSFRLKAFRRTKVSFRQEVSSLRSVFTNKLSLHLRPRPKYKLPSPRKTNTAGGQ